MSDIYIYICLSFLVTNFHLSIAHLLSVVVVDFCFCFFCCCRAHVTFFWCVAATGKPQLS